MKIPLYALPDRVTVRQDGGVNGRGVAVAGTETTGVRCRLEAKRKRYTGANGEALLSEAFALFRPDAKIAVKDKVIHGERTYTVEEIRKLPNESRTSHLEVFLK